MLQYASLARWVKTTLKCMGGKSVMLWAKATIVGALIVVVLSSSEASAGTKIWNGVGANNNWTTVANWFGGVIPVTGDDVIFDGTSTKNCTLDVAIGAGQANTGLKSG
jgi:hypothetical protein